ncbi:MAG: hypothetical protein AAF311_14785 [Pseudomonadota bacterium]
MTAPAPTPNTARHPVAYHGARQGREDVSPSSSRPDDPSVLIAGEIIGLSRFIALIDRIAGQEMAARGLTEGPS